MSNDSALTDMEVSSLDEDTDDFDILEVSVEEDGVVNEDLCMKVLSSVGEAEDCGDCEQLMRFEDFGLCEGFISLTRKNGFTAPTKVQMECLDEVLKGFDVLCHGYNGSGKSTLAFFGIVNSLLTACLSSTESREWRYIKAVILCPTTELCAQTQDKIQTFCRFTPECRVQAFSRGVKIKGTSHGAGAKHSPNIVIATAGTLLSMLVANKHKFAHVRYLIVDDCDQMFVGKCRHWMPRIFSFFKGKPLQTLMFTSDLDFYHGEARFRASSLMFNPIFLSVPGTPLENDGNAHFKVELPEKKKIRTLLSLLRSLRVEQAIIFVNTVDRCSELSDVLQGHVECHPLHSRLCTSDRMENYSRFAYEERLVVVASDLASVGLDIRYVNLVINFDFPISPELYSRRMGRSGRAGRKGLVISFVSSDEDKQELAAVERIVLDDSIPPLPDDVNPSLYVN